MTEATKNSHYKIDFKAKIFNEKFTISSFAARWRWSADTTDIRIKNFIKSMYHQNKKVEELAKLVDNDIIYKNAGPNYIQDVMKQIAIIIEKGYDNWKVEAIPQEGYNHHFSIAGFVERSLVAATAKSPEYLECDKQFQKWLSRRPGVKAIWDQSYPDKEMTLENFAAHYREKKFRKKLEQSRPKAFPEGTLVELKTEYRGKRGKDPFYYSTPEIRQQQRIGMVAKFQDSYYAYGVGSRSIKVMWLATGEESEIMERCLNVIKHET